MLAEVQALVNAVCEKYGVEFTATRDEGEWDFFVPHYRDWPTDQTSIIEALEPEVSDLLWTLLNEIRLGPLLDDYEPTSTYPMVRTGITGANLTVTSTSGLIPKPLADGFRDLEAADRTELYDSLPPYRAYIYLKAREGNTDA